MRANANQCLNFKNQFYSQKKTYLKAQHPASLVACSDAQGLPGYFTVLLIMLSFSTRGNLCCKFWLLILVKYRAGYSFLQGHPPPQPRGRWPLQGMFQGCSCFSPQGTLQIFASPPEPALAHCVWEITLSATKISCQNAEVLGPCKNFGLNLEVLH